MKKTLKTIIAALNSGRHIDTDLNGHSIKMKGFALDADSLCPIPQDECITLIESLYDIFRHSVPAEKDRGKRLPFKALKEEDLSAEDLLCRPPRSHAATILESAIILAAVSGSIAFDTLAPRRWFWQSSKQPELVLLRRWFS